MTLEEIKYRRLVNHHLAVPSDKLTVVRDLCGIQAQFLSNAIHAIKIRATGFEESTLDAGLIKNWSLRGTMHIFAADDLPLMLRSKELYRSMDWSVPSFWNQRECWALTPERQHVFSDVILEALEQGPKSRSELKEACRQKGITAAEESSMFDSWGGGIRELCERGFLNYTVQEDKTLCLAAKIIPFPEDEAELELAKRYFTHYGPATVHDAQYFFRTTAAKVNRWLSLLPVQCFETEGRRYFYIEKDGDVSLPLPDCLFLAGFDPFLLGYEKKESLILKTENLREIFNLAGIVMPSILFRGTIVGRWKKKNGTLSISLFEDLSVADRRLIEKKADELWQDIRRLEWK